MEETCKRRAPEDDVVDRISNLPTNIFDLILERMPIRCAVRTSILSRNWRYTWADCPTLVFDKKFAMQIRRERSAVQLYPARYPDVDMWILFLSKQGTLKEIELHNSKPEPFPYRLSSRILLFPELIALDIYNFIFKSPNTFQDLNKLNEPKIKKTTLESLVLDVPLLIHLELSNCQCIGNVHINAPRLKTLILEGNKGLEITSFMSCKDVDYPYLSLGYGVEYQKVTSVWNEIAWIICLLRGSRFLSNFEIWADDTVSNDAEVLAYSGQPGLVNQKIEQLHVVKMIDFNGSEVGT
ncbi:hypothetical protein M9H77_12773 [Catharanthus roseus]|uniref:Uncharacterized protein n=1 Tax=Catharanthus roseus TaxID=4058 RepID=A0ACC0BI95_CATRO|nr:hypothetical protein M9H77_12773 [Catharanthus roseus]